MNGALLALLLRGSACIGGGEGAPPPPQPSEDFELLPQEKAADGAALARRAELEQKLALRRKMLQLHQLGGFLTLASLGVTVVLGELDYLDKYAGRGDTGSYHAWHRWSAIASSAIFAGTASLAVFAPSPIEKPFRLDTAVLHKIAMSVAALGMASEIVLGIVTAGKEGQLSQRDYALAHQVIGFGTFAATATGFAVLTF